MSNIDERLIEIEIDGTLIQCVCDVIYNNYPDGVVVTVLEIQGIDSENFKREFVKDIASKIHEQIVNEQYEKQQEKLDYYDEGDR